MPACSLTNIFTPQSVIEGAGVRLHRVFGFHNTELTDPFLLLDDFSSKNPDDFRPGFPWHPHRGIETVTYLLEGEVAHRDSLGNHGVIGPDSLQWMSAGSGIIHEEMPDATKGPLTGFQLWINLSKSNKMSTPRYQDIQKNTVPVLSHKNHIIKVISGTYQGTSGPVKELNIPITYLDITLAPSTAFSLECQTLSTKLIYLFSSSLVLTAAPSLADSPQLFSFGSGDTIPLVSGPEGARFLFLSGDPLREPIAWQGPIVMNTQNELETAFQELSRGTFIKSEAIE